MDFKFGNALHISHTRCDKWDWAFVVGGIIILFASIVLLIFNGEKNVTKATWNLALTICAICIGIGASLIILSIVMVKIAYKKRKICFAIFNDYILISNNLRKDLEMKQISWNDISEYSFNEHRKGDDIQKIKTPEGNFRIGGYKMNYGGLRVIAHNMKIETNIDDINQAKELFIKYCPIAEKFDAWSDIKT